MATHQLVDAILPLIRNVSKAICGSGSLTVGYTRRDIPSNLMVVDFYHQMFKASLSVSEPPLAHVENYHICRDFVDLLESHPQLIQSWFLRPRSFVPIDFFLENFSVFPRLVAKCFHFIHHFPSTEDTEERTRRMLSLISWETTDGKEMLSSFWKLQFFDELMTSKNISPHHSVFLHQFLLLIKECKTLFSVSFYLLETIDSYSVEAHVVEVLEYRLHLLSRNQLFDTIREYDMLGIMENIGELLGLRKPGVIRSLLYNPQNHITDSSYLDNFQDIVEEYLLDQDRFARAENRSYEVLTRQFDKVVPEIIQVASQKAIPRFLLKNLINFFLNSVFINRSLAHCISQLVVFDFLHNASASVQIYASLMKVIKSLDMDAFLKCLLAGSDQSGQEYAYSYNWLDAKHNIHLFEKIIAFCHAGLRAKKKYNDSYTMIHTERMRKDICPS